MFEVRRRSSEDIGNK
jgi:hypothetical protein